MIFDERNDGGVVAIAAHNFSDGRLELLVSEIFDGAADVGGEGVGWVEAVEPVELAFVVYDFGYG